MPHVNPNSNGANCQHCSHNVSLAGPVHEGVHQPSPSPLSNGSSNHNGTGEVSEPYAVVSCPHVYTRNCMPVILLS